MFVSIRSCRCALHLCALNPPLVPYVRKSVFVSGTCPTVGIFADPGIRPGGRRWVSQEHPVDFRQVLMPNSCEK